jgi:hypothetical protein
MKIMLITCGIQGAVHFELIPRGQTVNEAYYEEILNGYVKLCIKKGPNFGPTIGFSAMTVLQRTWLFL